MNLPQRPGRTQVWKMKSGEAGDRDLFIRCGKPGCNLVSGRSRTEEGLETLHKQITLAQELRQGSVRARPIGVRIHVMDPSVRLSRSRKSGFSSHILVDGCHRGNVADVPYDGPPIKGHVRTGRLAATWQYRLHVSIRGWLTSRGHHVLTLMEEHGMEA